jgi:alanyl-tRNA synthetase
LRGEQARDGGFGGRGWGEGLSVAERLYYDAQELMAFEAEVTDIRLESRKDGVNRWQLALDRTAFYPESGGQPWDTGTLEAVARSGARLEVPVLAVVEDDGEVWHVVEKPLMAGTVVTGRVDGARRLDHMQQHTGQHLLSAVVLAELGVGTVSFHLGAVSSTIDLGGAVGAEDLVRVEEVVNRLIGEDRRVSVSVVEREVAEGMLERGELRKLPERDGAMRVVEIEGVEWNACGGTHMASTGRIGGLVVRRVEKVKQGVRVEFCCGLRAVRAARGDFETVGELGRLLSTGAGELVGKVRGLLEDVKVGEKARVALLEELAGMEARALIGEGRVVEAAARDVTYAKMLAWRVAGLGRVAVVTAVEGDRGTVVLAAASGVDCGAAMKAALGVMGARGGGSATLAQGGVAAVDVERLVELLRVELEEKRRV